MHDGVEVAEVEVAEVAEVEKAEEEEEVKLEGLELAKECLWLGDDGAMEEGNGVDLVCGPTSVHDSTGDKWIIYPTVLALAYIWSNSSVA